MSLHKLQKASKQLKYNSFVFKLYSKKYACDDYDFQQTIFFYLVSCAM